VAGPSPRCSSTILDDQCGHPHQGNKHRVYYILSVRMVMPYQAAQGQGLNLSAAIAAQRRVPRSGVPLIPRWAAPTTAVRAVFSMIGSHERCVDPRGINHLARSHRFAGRGSMIGTTFHPDAGARASIEGGHRQPGPITPGRGQWNAPHSPGGPPCVQRASPGQVPPPKKGG